MRVPQARRKRICRASPVKVKPLRGGLAADLDSAVAAQLPALSPRALKPAQAGPPDLIVLISATA